jgi:uncharacterized membrane protein
MSEDAEDSPESSAGALVSSHGRAETAGQRVHELLDSEGVPRETVREVVQVIEEQTVGMFPPPSMLKGYEEALPGAADRIFRYAEQYGEHEREMERKMVESTIEMRRATVSLRRRGQVFAFVVAMTGLVAGAALLAAGISVAGYAVLLGAVGTIVADFIGVRITRARRRWRAPIGGDQSTDADDGASDEPSGGE